MQIFAKTFVLKIAVNTRLILKGKMDGIGWFTLETMTRVAQLHPDHSFLFLFDRPYHPSFSFPPNVSPLVIRPITRLPSLLKIWNYISVPLALQRIKPDLYFSPDGFLPPKPSVPSIVAIHDLNFEHYPNFIPKGYRNIYKTWVRRSAEEATRIMTVSDFSKEDIIRTYGVNNTKIDLVYSGLNNYLKPVSHVNIQQILSKHGITGRYFIVTGTLHPRKNTHGTIEAYSLFRQGNHSDVKLVFAGNNKWFSSELKNSLNSSNFRDDIIFTGRVSDTDMNALIHGAYALIFVSFFEGFGLPIIEAAAAGIPVITSNNSSMKEIASDSALLVNPESADEIADAMLRIVSDDDLRRRLISSSKDLPGKFSWSITAELMWNSFLKALAIEITNRDDTIRP